MAGFEQAGVDFIEEMRSMGVSILKCGAVDFKNENKKLVNDKEREKLDGNEDNPVE